MAKQVRRHGGLGCEASEALEAENARLKKLLAESMLENEVTRDALRTKWGPRRRVVSWCGGCRRRGSRSDAV